MRLALHASHRPSDPRGEAIPEFTTSAQIALVNAQDAEGEVNIGGGVLANYREWTDVAIEIAERELSKRGATMSATGGRQLELAITRADYSQGWVKLETQIDLTVTRGDGVTKTYTGINNSSMVAIIKRQIDGAMMRAVKEMLSDPELVAYLGG